MPDNTNNPKDLKSPGDQAAISRIEQLLKKHPELQAELRKIKTIESWRALRDSFFQSTGQLLPFTYFHDVEIYQESLTRQSTPEQTEQNTETHEEKAHQESEDHTVYTHQTAEVNDSQNNEEGDAPQSDESTSPEPTLVVSKRTSPANAPLITEIDTDIRQHAEEEVARLSKDPTIDPKSINPNQIAANKEKVILTRFVNDYPEKAAEYAKSDPRVKIYYDDYLDRRAAEVNPEFSSPFITEPPPPPDQFTPEAELDKATQHVKNLTETIHEKDRTDSYEMHALDDRLTAEHEDEDRQDQKSSSQSRMRSELENRAKQQGKKLFNESKYSQKLSEVRSQVTQSGKDALRNTVNKGTRGLSNATKKLFKGGGKTVARGGRVAAKAGSSTAKFLGGTIEFWGPIVLILLIIFLFILFIIIVLSQDEIQFPPTQATVKKTGPATVSNPSLGRDGSLIIYQLTVSMPPSTIEVEVTDTLDENAKFYTTTGPNATFYDASGNVVNLAESGSEDRVRTIKWIVRGSQHSDPAQPTLFDQATYTAMGFPNAETPNPIRMEGEALARWTTTAKTLAERVSGLTGVDAGVIGMWSFFEGINYDPLYDNCTIGTSIEKNPNTSCSVDNWQVGYGIRPAETYGYLQEAYDKMYEGASTSVQQVGQSVIAASGGGLTYPGTTFPDRSIAELLTGARARDPNDRAWVAMLMRDPAIGTYIIAKVFNGLQGPNMASRMEAWEPSYYVPQRIVNHIKAVYEAGLGGSGLPSQGSTLTWDLQVEPRTDNSYVVNIATITGGTGGGAPGGQIPPTTDNCAGKYDLSGNYVNRDSGTTTPKMNFGDPQCDFAEDKLQAQLHQLDSTNEALWYSVARCESGFNPNVWRDPRISPQTPDPGGAWGLFQMGSSLNGPGTAGEGLHGPFDRGDVIWYTQITNAINYYKSVLQPAGLGIAAYWQCAR